MTLSLEKSYISLSNEWFDVMIYASKIEIYSRYFVANEKDNRQPTINIDLEKGLCNVLNIFNNKNFSGQPTFYVDWNEEKIKYNFTLVLLRDEKHN